MTRSLPVKILGEGQLTKKLNVTVSGVSHAAAEKIAGAGGSVVVIKQPQGGGSK